MGLTILKTPFFTKNQCISDKLLFFPVQASKTMLKYRMTHNIQLDF